ncbi:MAG: tetratricopeptide repeat protein, partial [Kiritimatiellae bacterium]|nr:tetratricopeptide repeat protein [Kiritimatiellia bacterium]
FLRDLLEPDPAKRLADPAAITRRLDAIGRAIAPATRRRRRAAGFALAVAAILATVAGVLHFHAEPVTAIGSHAESAESAESAEPGPAAGWGSGEAEPPPVAIVFPAYPMPPRLDSVWQGEDRGPLQLLGTFRMLPIVRLEAEAFTGDGAEILRKLHEGDGAWSSWTRDRAALERAKNVWSEAVGIARKEAAYADAAPAARVRLALCLARLSWTHVANADHGAADEPYRAALAAVDPLVESDPARYGPLRSWLLSERAYMECMEGRFGEAAEDLKESGLLWAAYAPDDDPGCTAQLAVIAASLGGMVKAVGDPANAIKPTEGAIKELAGLVGDPPVPDGPASAALANLLVGCHYRLGDLDASIANRLEALRHYRLALDAWRSVRAATGASDPDADAQILGRIGGALAELERYAEAADAWAEMREALREPLASDPARYRPVVADILGNEARAFRLLGDEEAARAREAEAAALRAAP